jgi:hypothetical protein
MCGKTAHRAHDVSNVTAHFAEVHDIRLLCPDHFAKAADEYAVEQVSAALGATKRNSDRVRVRYAAGCRCGVDAEYVNDVDPWAKEWKRRPSQLQICPKSFHRDSMLFGATTKHKPRQQSCAQAHPQQQSGCRGGQAVPPTVILSMRSVGWPTPTGTP